MTSGRRRARRERREIDQQELFETLQRHPDWSAARLADELGYASANAVRRYLKRYLNRGELREVIEVVPGPLRPLDAQFLIGIVTDQQIYRAPEPGDFPLEASYRDQQSLTAHLLEHLSGPDVIVHDAMLVLGAPFDILLFVSARRGVADIAPLVTSTLRRYRGIGSTLTMPVGAWHRQ